MRKTFEELVAEYLPLLRVVQRTHTNEQFLLLVAETIARSDKQCDVALDLLDVAKGVVEPHKDLRNHGEQ